MTPVLREGMTINEFLKENPDVSVELWFEESDELFMASARIFGGEIQGSGTTAEEAEKYLVEAMLNHSA